MLGGVASLVPSLCCLSAGFVLLAACEDKTPRSDPAPAPVSPPAAPAPEPPKTESVPDLVIDSIGPKVGAERIDMKSGGAVFLGMQLNENRGHFEGKAVRLSVDRKAQPIWVSVFLAELAKLGVSEVQVRTETRPEYPSEVRFTPVSKLDSPAPCSVVAMILEDRGTAVWKLSGGVAGKRAKGMAGPDLTMTGETIERIAKACDDDTALFVAGAHEIEWGLVYDLAASAQSLGGKRLFETRVLLSDQIVPGRRVPLKP